MIKIVSFSLLLVFLCLIIKKEEAIVTLLLIAGCLFLFSFAYEEILVLYSTLEDFTANSKILTVYLKQFFKILAITYLGDFGSSLCKDAGYQTLGKQIELVGKVFILAVTVPLLLTVLNTVFELF